MATSVVYASIFAAVMALLPVIATKLFCFDTAILDLSDELADPVEVLFGVQLDGGTDISAALAYCQGLVTQPGKTHPVLISDLYEGGNAAEMLERAAAMVSSGVNLVALLALSDDGRPSYDTGNAPEARSTRLPGLRLHARPLPRSHGAGALPRRPPRLGRENRHRDSEGGGGRPARSILGTMLRTCSSGYRRNDPRRGLLADARRT